MSEIDHNDGGPPTTSPLEQQQPTSSLGGDDSAFDFSAMQSAIETLMQRVKDSETAQENEKTIQPHSAAAQDTTDANTNPSQTLHFHGAFDEPSKYSSSTTNPFASALLASPPLPPPPQHNAGSFTVTSSPPSVNLPPPQLPISTMPTPSPSTAFAQQQVVASTSSVAEGGHVGDHIFVGNLEPRTSESDLYRMFFPMGAVKAILHNTQGSSSSSSMRKSGLVVFSSPRAAQIAAEKLNNFVPHGQSQPLSVVWLPLAAAAGGTAATGGAPFFNQPVPPTKVTVQPAVLPVVTVAAAAPPHHLRVPLLPQSSSTTVLSLGAMQLDAAIKSKHPIIMNSTSAGKDIAQLLLRHSDKEKMIDVLLQTLREDQQRGLSLFISLLSYLESEPSEKIQLQEIISRTLVKCILEPSADKSERTGCAIAAGYLFDHNFIARTPFAMARKLMQTRLGSSPADAVLVDALVSLTSSWSCRHADRSKNDPDEEAFRGAVHRYYTQHQITTGSSSNSSGGAGGSIGPDTSSESIPPPLPSTPGAKIATGAMQRSSPPSCGPSLSSEEGYATETEQLACTVYLAHVSPSVSEARLRTLFLSCGDFNKVRLYDNPRRPGSFGFVEFSSAAGAKLLIQQMDRLDLDGMSLRCSQARSIIHDHDSRDAIFAAGGRVRGCLFGLTAKPRNVPSRH